MNHQSNTLAEIFESLSPELALVRQSLEELLATDNLLVKQGVASLHSPHSKYFRPLLSLLCSQLVGYTHDQRIILGVISEYIHMASLLHDDVVDNAALRRGRSSCQVQFGNSRAVLVGDYVYARACELIANTGSLAVLKLYAQAIRLMSEGEVMQLADLGALNHSIMSPMLPMSPRSPRSPHISLERYTQIINYKTGALIGAVAVAPYELMVHQSPQITHDPLKANSLYNYGLLLGMAFQVVDDILDYTESAQAIKPAWQDFNEGKLTLPLYFCVQGFDSAEYEYFSETFFDSSRRLEAKAWYQRQLQKHQAFDQSLDFASKLARDAIHSLEQRFDRSSAAQMLLELAHDVLKRANSWSL